MSALQYPICLNIAGRRCLVVGGGQVAARKAIELERCGARVDVIAPSIKADVETLEREHRVSILRRVFVPDDLLNAVVVIAATNDQKVNSAIADACERAGVLVNVVDVPELCSFTVPALLRRGLLTIAVSTTGASPGLSGRVRDEISTVIGSEWSVVLEVVGAFRRTVIRRFFDAPSIRTGLLSDALKLDVVSIVRAGGREALEKRLEAFLEGRTANGGTK